MDICLECGRRIKLMGHGNFRKHFISKGNVCPGSWKWPKRQREALEILAKPVLKEMALIEEAEHDGDDRWNTLKGYLEAALDHVP